MVCQSLCKCRDQGYFLSFGWMVAQEMFLHNLLFCYSADHIYSQTLLGPSWWNGGISLQAAPACPHAPRRGGSLPWATRADLVPSPSHSSGLQHTPPCSVPSRQHWAVPGEHRELGLLLWLGPMEEKVTQVAASDTSSIRGHIRCGKPWVKVSGSCA